MDMRSIINLIETPDLISGVSPDVLKELAEQGFTMLPLYHGSPEVLDKLDHTFSRTADFIYTSPDADTAGSYGKHLYLCVGRQDPQADLIDDHRLLGKLSDTFAPDYYDAVETDEDLQALAERIVGERSDDPDFDEWDAKETPEYRALLHSKAREWVYNMITGGETYGIRGQFQDALMSECFGNGAKSVRFADPSSHGESISVVFATGDDVVIVRQIR